MAKAEIASRRTQQERREATTNIILDATLECIEKYGYVMTSIGRIVELSGVSRGGLMHHFPTKQKLVAGAFIRFHQKRAERLKELILHNDGKTLSLKDRIAIFRKEIEEWFPISIEFLTASMKDQELNTAFNIERHTYMEPMKKSYEALFPEFSQADNNSSQELMHIMGCFVRGLCIDSISTTNPNDENKLFDRFVSLIEMALKNTKGETSSG